MSHPSPPWWRRDPRGCAFSEPQEQPTPGQTPAFAIGDRVRLRGKPHRVRAVVAVEWHRYCHTFVYIVETSGQSWYPYWFEEQLEKVDAR